jgi:hypothetical protein
VDDLVAHHFSTWSYPTHQNAENLSIALNLLGSRPATIVETGTSAYGTDSSRLFDSYVKNYGGNFYSIDIRKQAKYDLIFQHSRQSKFLVGDSVEKLSDLSESEELSYVDLVYLDSWDVDWFRPELSAKHGLNEFLAIERILKPGSVLVVDDTPKSANWIPFEARGIASTFKKTHGVLPGKGALIIELLRTRKNCEIIAHDYNVVFQFT